MPRDIIRRPALGVSALDYKGQLGGDVNEQKNYVDIFPVTLNPNSITWSLFVEIYTPSNMGDPNWYNITIYSQNNGTGTGRSWITIPLAAPNKGTISSALGGGVTRSSNVIAKPDTRYTIVLRFNKATNTLDWHINGQYCTSYPGIAIENATGSHRIGAGKDDPTLPSPHGTRCFPGKIGRVGLYENVLLTQEQITLLHNGCFNEISTTGDVFKMSMEQNNGETVRDISGNNNHGTIKVWATDPAGPNPFQMSWVDGFFDGKREEITRETITRDLI